MTQRARKFKKVQAKKLVKSNESISRNFSLTNINFLQFQKWPKINFWTGQKFKTAKNAISRKMFWLIWFHEFFCMDFLSFLAHCVVRSFLNIFSSRILFRVMKEPWEERLVHGPRVRVQRVQDLRVQRVQDHWTPRRTCCPTPPPMFQVWVSKIHAIQMSRSLLQAKLENLLT